MNWLIESTRSQKTHDSEIQTSLFFETFHNRIFFFFPLFNSCPSVHGVSVHLVSYILFSPRRKTGLLNHHIALTPSCSAVFHQYHENTNNTTLKSDVKHLNTRDYADEAPSLKEGIIYNELNLRSNLNRKHFSRIKTKH